MNRLILSSVNGIGLHSKINCVSIMAKRFCGPVADWKPGPYPVTQEERERAARKYYLVPDDYKPFPEGSGYGDYPDLPIVSMEARDAFEDFDWHYRRRNFGETLHIDYDLHTADKLYPDRPLQHTPLYMVTCFLSLVSSFIFIGWCDQFFDLRIVYPMKPKQMPAKDVVNYTFEPLDH